LARDPFDPCSRPSRASSAARRACSPDLHRGSPEPQLREPVSLPRAGGAAFGSECGNGFGGRRVVAVAWNAVAAARWSRGGQRAARRRREERGERRSGWGLRRAYGLRGRSSSVFFFFFFFFFTLVTGPRRSLSLKLSDAIESMSQSIWAHQIGEPGLFSAPKLTGLYHTPGLLT